MAVFRVEKNKGYTVMSNHHLRNKENRKKEGGGKDEKKETACYEIEALNALQNLTI